MFQLAPARGAKKMPPAWLLAQLWLSTNRRAGQREGLRLRPDLTKLKCQELATVLSNLHSDKEKTLNSPFHIKMDMTRQTMFLFCSSDVQTPNKIRMCISQGYALRLLVTSPLLSSGETLTIDFAIWHWHDTGSLKMPGQKIINDSNSACASVRTSSRRALRREVSLWAFFKMRCSSIKHKLIDS